MTNIMNTFKTLLSTVLNEKNVTTNNLTFLMGLAASAGLIVYGVLNIFMPAILAVLIMFSATAFFGYRTLTSNEELPAKERANTTTRSTY